MLRRIIAGSVDDVAVAVVAVVAAAAVVVGM